MIDINKNKTIIIFPNQANSALNELMKKYDLNEPAEIFSKKLEEKKLINIVIIDQSCKKFASRGIKTEKELSESLQKELGVDTKKAGEVAKELIEKVVPLLQKVTEEQLADPDFLGEFDRKYFGGPGKQNNGSPSSAQIGSGFSGSGADLFPKEEIDGRPTSTELPAGSETGHTLPKQIEKIKFDEPENVGLPMSPKIVAREEGVPAPRKRGRPAKVETAQPPSIMPMPSQNKGADNYREPIE